MGDEWDILAFLSDNASGVELNSNMVFCLAEAIKRDKARVDELEHVVRGMVGWLTKNQPDVYSRGIWDAIARNTDE